MAQPDDSFITISGTVKSVAPDGFALDYGDGLLTIEMDSPRGNSGYTVVIGDKVTVTGVVDDDRFERGSVEASSVYIDRLGTHFFAPSAIDEEDVIATAVVTPVPVLEAASWWLEWSPQSAMASSPSIPVGAGSRSRHHDFRKTPWRGSDPHDWRLASASAYWARWIPSSSTVAS